MDGLFLAAAFVILLATSVALYRVLAGPVVVDRLLGLNVAGTKTIAVILLTGFLFDRVEFFVDIAFVYGMINFIGVLALASYFERKGVVPRRAAE
jgi:multicomponent Na+:H+ antiporter subunit F